MQNYTPDLQGRRIVMISDFVSSGYDEEDLRDEEAFLQTIKNEAHASNIAFDFIEVANEKELAAKLDVYNKNEIVIFNWCEEFEEKANTGYLVTQFLENEGYVFTGADTQSLKLGMNKLKLYDVLRNNKVNIPRTYTFEDTVDQIEFPVIAKAIYEHGSYQITNDSVLENIHQYKQMKTKLDNTKFYMEQFIPGRELYVSIFGNANNHEILPIVELVFELNVHKHNIQTTETKWDKNSPFYQATHDEIPTDLSDEISDKIKQQAVLAFKAIKNAGFVRMEIRLLDKTPYLIDFNPNPYFGANSSTITAAEKLGYNEGNLVIKMCEYALTKTN